MIIYKPIYCMQTTGTWYRWYRYGSYRQFSPENVVALSEPGEYDYQGAKFTLIKLTNTWGYDSIWLAREVEKPCPTCGKL